MESDTLLLVSTRNMNQDALLAIFDRYAPALYHYAFFLCSSAVIADQVVGEVFVRLSDDTVTGRVPRVNLRSYLYEIAYHLFVDETAYSDRPAPIDTARLRSGDSWPVEINSEDRLSFEIVQQALKNDLTDDQRHVIILRFMAGFSLKETAAIMGKKVGNVKVIQNRAIAALREALGNQMVETRAITLLIMRMAHS